MPFRAGLYLIALLLTGCSIWPDQAHRALSAQVIESIVSEHCAVNTTLNTSAQEQQQALLAQIQAQLNMLTAATPGFSNAHCAPVEHTSAANHEFEGKVVVGANEWIYLSPPGHHYQARIDSGAATSSLSAMNVEYFERNGKRWVRFALQHDDETNAIDIEAKVIRHVLIRQASSAEPERRPVISLTVNMGHNLRYDTEFTLTNRSQMTYPILLGREFLRDVILIDVARQFIHPKYEPQDISLSELLSPNQVSNLEKD
ncbi:ATP-dependent zinc protease family protein [Bermanella sp. WJH001]|mgnify:CR=1 FL=1|uniref:ATP-dependent zinc protease family protein n=1 Tax=Bermanella sp. WJH001 TaxID=3048005 RepID=UPI0024BEA539|nr:ATP-dependent zinc protease [Bermanella sp. WJH001]MDJ1538414.1 ATP-dependent zinc protease [Bermanella sp. WJH001]